MGISSQKNTNPRGTMVLLSTAICEWILIFLLFLDSTFSYIIRRFAEYCELPTPCLFCSRIDTPSGKRKFGCYNALLCISHREEISSLVSCHVHGNIVDVREMCEECFMPMHDKLNSGSYMVGKSGLEIEQHRVQSLLLHRQILLTSSGPRICKCCHKSWGAKPYSQRFIDLTSVDKGASKANVKPPLPRVPGRSRFSRRNSFRKRRVSAPATPRSVDKSLSDAMSPASYTDLNYTSDSESEVPILDGKEGSFAVRGRNDMNLEHGPHYVERTLVKSQTADAVLEKQSNHTSADLASLLDQPMQLETHQSLPTYGLEELNWEQLHQRTNNPVSKEINILDDVIEAPSNTSEDASITVEPRPHMSSITTLAELISLKNTKSGSDDTNKKTFGMTLAQQLIKATGISNGGVPSVEEKEVSTTSIELPSASDSTKFEDIKSVIHQYAPKQDDSQNIGASSSSTSSDANHVQDLASILKLSESESLSDDEDETTIDMLKSQIEYDRKCLDDLYKELEEERNAATIAANQAMAMITRLQEEKAALHMETLQYIRMMDEQAEYDIEALQKANDQLAEKEKELQDLEYELESYRDNINGGSPVLNPHKESIGTTSKNTTDVLNPHKESIDTQSKNTTEVLNPHKESISPRRKNTTEVLNPHKESISPRRKNTTEVLNPHKESISATRKNTTEVLNPHKESIDTPSKNTTEVLNPHKESISTPSKYTTEVLNPHKESISTARRNTTEVLNPHKESISPRRKNTTEILNPHKESISPRRKNTTEILNPHKESISATRKNTTEVINPHKESISATRKNTTEVLNPHKESTTRKNTTEGSVMIFPMSLQSHHRLHL